MLADRYDLPVSTTSVGARDAYVRGCDLALNIYPAAMDAFDRAISADPGFALAHVGKALWFMREANVMAARESVAAAKALAAGLTEQPARRGTSRLMRGFRHESPIRFASALQRGTPMNKRLTAAVAATMLAAGISAANAQEPLRIGAILDMSGVYADVTGPGTDTAIRLAVQDFGGKVLGRPVEVLNADHQNKADIAAGIATKWFDTEKVEALMDVASSSPALAVMNVAHQRRKVVILNGPGAASITNEACNDVTVHYTYNTYATSRAVTKAVIGQGGKSWYYITADYAFGKQLEADSGALVKASGGTVLGSARAPLDTPDFSSFLVQAAASKAQVIALANGGGDLINSVKQASEFGLTKGGTKLASLGANVNDVHGIGLQATEGMMVADAFYWDTDDESRAFAKRFYDKLHKMPNMLQAGAYSATMHYLQAVQAAGTTEASAVMAKMRELPVHDFFARNGKVRIDGLMVHDMHLFQVKSPAESKGEWDLYKHVATIPGDEAYQSLADSRCPLVKK
jgi:branched-chain amino acid transport system substrate-binding protein